LAEIGGEGHHLGPVLGLQPLEDDRGVEPAGIGEDDFLHGRGHGGASWTGMAGSALKGPKRATCKARVTRGFPPAAAWLICSAMTESDATPAEIAGAAPGKPLSPAARRALEEAAARRAGP